MVVLRAEQQIVESLLVHQARTSYSVLKLAELGATGDSTRDTRASPSPNAMAPFHRLLPRWALQ